MTKASNFIRHVMLEGKILHVLTNLFYLIIKIISTILDMTIGKKVLHASGNDILSINHINIITK